MNIQRNTLALIATIFSGIQVLFTIFLVIALQTQRNSPMLENEITTALYQQGISFAQLGLDFQQLIDAALLMFVLGLIFYLVKFLIGLFGYLNNNHKLIFISLTLSLIMILVIIILLSAPIFAFLDLIILVLYYLAYKKIKTMQLNSQDKTVIDIQL